MCLGRNTRQLLPCPGTLMTIHPMTRTPLKPLLRHLLRQQWWRPMTYHSAPWRGNVCSWHHTKTQPGGISTTQTKPARRPVSSCVDDAIVLGSRAVTPKSLRTEVLDGLQAAHCRHESLCMYQCVLARPICCHRQLPQQLLTLWHYNALQNPWTTFTSPWPWLPLPTRIGLLWIVRTQVSRVCQPLHSMGVCLCHHTQACRFPCPD